MRISANAVPAENWSSGIGLRKGAFRGCRRCKSWASQRALVASATAPAQCGGGRHREANAGRTGLCAELRSLALAVGCAAWQARDGLDWLPWLKELPQTAMKQFDSGWSQMLTSLWSSALPGSAWNWMVLLSAGATLALLSGVVVYLAAEKQ